ncbi:ABC transporter permease [Bifidobacterium ramosum]|uniref:ABC transporter permease n=1 Tax=Bifidobacterium ramosum TaxID=1798158 RepID=A0A6L4WXS7_9BIFI|nr:carbohydrate ABC transporter permease [Bifidobacterium ramosum]KAB8286752.1 ABC transporter permease [Bifidobacterium ramosum]NEG72762.1 ABC transporter permease subunit [Bifidobacterium ramosum]
MNRDSLARKAVRSILVLALACVCAVPLYYVLVSAFKDKVEMMRNPLGLPSHLNLDNFIQAFQSDTLGTAFLNTIIVTVFGVIIQVLIGSLAAYGMTLHKNVFTVVMGLVLVVAFAVPAQAVMLPQYRMEASLGLVDTLLGVIVLYAGGCVFCYFLIIGYMTKLPRELLEAARIDGAGAFRTYWSVVLPLTRPILATVVIFQALGSWNDFLTPSVYLSTPDKRTLVLEIYAAASTYSTNWPLFMATTVIALTPAVIFFVCCQKYIAAGLVAGAVKG